MSTNWGWIATRTSPTSVVLSRVFDDQGNRGRVGVFNLKSEGWEFMPNSTGKRKSRKGHPTVLAAARSRMLPVAALDAIRALD